MSKILIYSQEDLDLILELEKQENEELQQENKQLKIQISAREEVCNRLESNWNKLKEYLHNVDAVIDYSENYNGRFINYDELIDKMQELEQGSDE